MVNKMNKYRKKPVVIEAVQYTGDNKKEIIDFSGRTILTNTCYVHLNIPTHEGNMKANVTDWVIKGVHGELYPIKNDIFLETYEAVE